MSTAENLRVLVASHGHPKIAKGGGEIAAYGLFRQLAATPECDTWFLGCGRDRADLQASITQPFDEREFVYAGGAFDWFKYANRDARFPGELAKLIADTMPDIIHFHHYANFGVEAFHTARQAAPRAKLILTLHEYQAICAHYGQMITRARNLCRRASPADCVRCFPDRLQSDFFIREWYIKLFFDEIDHFIAPSRFLMRRYIEWGLPEEKVTSLANVIAAPTGDETGQPRADDSIFRAGLFGQLSFFKGIDVVIEAARLLDAAGIEDIVIEVHGDDRGLPPELRAELAEQLAKAGPNIRLCGPYDETEVDRLMRGVDVVLVPSIWWENRPLVIEEALRNRRPVICSNIGGMAETVRDGIDGFHFPVGDAAGLARLMRRLAGERSALAAMRDRIAGPPPPESVAAQHLALYRRVLGRPASA